MWKALSHAERNTSNRNENRDGRSRRKYSDRRRFACFFDTASRADGREKEYIKPFLHLRSRNIFYPKKAELEQKWAKTVYFVEPTKINRNSDLALVVLMSIYGLRSGREVRSLKNDRRGL